jgi:hypothetical protein
MHAAAVIARRIVIALPPPPAGWQEPSRCRLPRIALSAQLSAQAAAASSPVPLRRRKRPRRTPAPRSKSPRPSPPPSSSTAKWKITIFPSPSRWARSMARRSRRRRFRPPSSRATCSTTRSRACSLTWSRTTPRRRRLRARGLLRRLPDSRLSHRSRHGLEVNGMTIAGEQDVPLENKERVEFLKGIAGVESGVASAAASSIT